MKKIVLLSLLLCGCLISYGSATDSLRADLETCYMEYSNAINHYELENIEKHMSAHKYRRMRNLVTSQKLTFPDDFIIDICYELVSLKKAKFLYTQVNENTATAAYFGKGVYHSKALIVLSFVKEGDAWKYDGIKEKHFHDFKTVTAPKTLDSLKEFYAPNGYVPKTEQEIDSVDYKGWFNMHVQGYLVTMKINGMEQDIYNDVIKSGVVMGGLSKGKNTFQLELIPIANVDKRDIRISIRGFISEAERDVFHLYQAEGEIFISREFEIKEYANLQVY